MKIKKEVQNKTKVQQNGGMMVIADRHRRIEYVNESFETVTGYKFEEVQGKNPRLLSSGKIPKSVFQNMWLTLMSGQTWKGGLCNKKIRLHLLGAFIHYAYCGRHRAQSPGERGA